MIRKIALVIITWSIILAVIYVTSHSHIAATVAADAFSVAILSLIIGGSIYKLALWWRYRHDPEKRQSVIFSTQLYPARLARLLTDDDGDRKKR